MNDCPTLRDLNKGKSAQLWLFFVCQDASEVVASYETIHAATGLSSATISDMLTHLNRLGLVKALGPTLSEGAMRYAVHRELLPVCGSTLETKALNPEGALETEVLPALETKVPPSVEPDSTLETEVLPALETKVPGKTLETKVPSVKDSDLEESRSNQSLKSGAGKSPKKAKPISQTEQAKLLLKRPAMVVYRDEAHLQIRSAWRVETDQAVGEDPQALDNWRLTIHTWIGKGWNPGNIKGMLDRFVAGDYLCEQRADPPPGKNGSDPYLTSDGRVRLYHPDILKAPPQGDEA